MKTKKPFAEAYKRRFIEDDLIARDNEKYNQQGKKDKDELQNVSLSGVTKNKQRKKLNAGDRSVNSDTHPVEKRRKK